MDDNEPRTEGRGALAARTVLHHHWLLKESLDRAVKWQRMARNPMGDVIPPRPETKEARALTQPQTTTVIGLARGKRYYLAVMIALTTGMRRGEICALRWSKVDLARASLSVVQTLEEVKKRDLATGRPAPALTFKAPKTKKSRRTIALPAIAVEELRRHKAQQAKEKLLMGRAYADEDLVFANVDGTPYRPNLLTVNYASLIRRAPVKHGLHGTSFHTLRHTHATRLLEQGVHVKIVSERLGHSTIAITLDTYSHVLPGIQEGAAEKMDASLRAAIAAS
jgi:integrase